MSLPDAARDVLTARSPAVVRLLGSYMRHYAARRFHAVRIARGTWPSVPAGAPVVVCANHPSWWDPLLFALLQPRAFPGRAGFGPMEDAALGRYGILRRIGVFGIAPGAAGARRFLAVATGLLAGRDSVLWVTAEGAFRDPRDRPLRLRPGIAHLMRSVPGLVAVPLALEYPFWNERTPEALVRCGPALAADPARPVAAWTALLERALTGTMDQLAPAARARDPAAFETLVRGKAGVGGLYDLGRRARAAWRGASAQLEHDG